MMGNDENLLLELGELRSRIQEATQQRDRLQGEMEATKKRLTNLHGQLKSQYDCDPTGADALIQRLRAEAAESKEKVRRILDGEVVAPVAAPVSAPVAASREPVVAAVSSAVEEDEDGLLG